MCKIYGYRFHCNHTQYRVLSSCRGTFASPANPNLPRCIPAAPSVVLHLDDACRDCGHSNFCAGWEERIDALKTRRNVLTEVLDELDESEDLWHNDSWYLDAESQDEAEHKDDYFSVTPQQWRSRWPSAPQQVKAAGDFDAESARIERDRLDEELRHSEATYYQQAWEHWHSFTSGSKQSEWAKRNQRASKRRKTRPRIAGGSPLSTVTHADDLPTPARQTSEIAPESPPSESSDDESTLTAPSVPSPRDSFTSATALILSFLTMDDGGRCKPRRPRLDATVDWVKDVQNIKPSCDARVVQDEGEHGDLFPAWDNAQIG